MSIYIKPHRRGKAIVKAYVRPGSFARISNLGLQKVRDEILKTGGNSATRWVNKEFRRRAALARERAKLIRQVGGR